ncbi:MAG: GTP-binding protein [Actinomycetota bacterium]
MRYQEPEFLPWDGRRVPLTFIAGYLGAGKTTLINRVLADTDHPVAILVNDVGEINIDARLIKRQSGETIELNDGCVCCSIVEGFGEAFDQIRERETPPDHLVVELSGVADPGRCLPWGRTAGFRLDGVLTLVAADQIHELVERSDIGEMVRAQIATADMVAITKLDVEGAAPEAKVRELIAEIGGDVPVVDAGDGAVTSTLLRVGGRRKGGTADLPDATLFDRHEVGSIPLHRPIEVAEVEAIVDGLDDSVMRAKAIFEDPSGSRWSVQVVGRRCTIAELPDVESEAVTDLVTISVRQPGSIGHSQPVMLGR